MKTSMPYICSKHAMQRYRQRVEPCSLEDADERLLHAAEIALPPTTRQITWMAENHYGAHGTRYLYCREATLMLVLIQADECNSLVIITCFVVPTDQQLRQHYAHRRKKKQRGHARRFNHHDHSSHEHESEVA